MILVSLLLNLLVLGPVCLGLIRGAAWARASYGESSPARGILLSVYLAIAIASAWLIFYPEPQRIFALLALQVVYKVTTPVTVGTVRHPVVISNLVIAAVHGFTLATLWGR